MSNICQGQTVKKKPCRNRTNCGTYCHLHRNQEIVKKKEEEEIKTETKLETKTETEDVECVICYEPWVDRKKIIFSCGHNMCEVCVNQLNKAECPFCRHDLRNEVQIKVQQPPVVSLNFDQLSEIFDEVEAARLLISTLPEDERSIAGVLNQFGDDNGLRILLAFINRDDDL